MCGGVGSGGRATWDTGALHPRRRHRRLRCRLLRRRRLRQRLHLRRWPLRRQATCGGAAPRHSAAPRAAASPRGAHAALPPRVAGLLTGWLLARALRLRPAARGAPEAVRGEAEREAAAEAAAEAQREAAAEAAAEAGVGGGGGGGGGDGDGGAEGRLSVSTAGGLGLAEAERAVAPRAAAAAAAADGAAALPPPLAGRRGCCAVTRAGRTAARARATAAAARSGTWPSQRGAPPAARAALPRVALRLLARRAYRAYLGTELCSSARNCPALGPAARAATVPAAPAAPAAPASFASTAAPSWYRGTSEGLSRDTRSERGGLRGGLRLVGLRGGLRAPHAGITSRTRGTSGASCGGGARRRARRRLAAAGLDGGGGGGWPGRRRRAGRRCRVRYWAPLGARRPGGRWRPGRVAPSGRGRAPAPWTRRRSAAAGGAFGLREERGAGAAAEAGARAGRHRLAPGQQGTSRASSASSRHGCCRAMRAAEGRRSPGGGVCSGRVGAAPCTRPPAGAAAQLRLEEGLAAPRT